MRRQTDSQTHPRTVLTAQREDIGCWLLWMQLLWGERYRTSSWLYTSSLIQEGKVYRHHLMFVSEESRLVCLFWQLLMWAEWESYTATDFKKAKDRDGNFGGGLSWGISQARKKILKVRVRDTGLLTFCFATKHNPSRVPIDYPHDFLQGKKIAVKKVQGT